MENIGQNSDLCNDFLKKLNCASIKSDDLNIEVDFLIEDFLPRGSIVQFYSKPGQGKSLFALSVSLLLAREKSMEVIYIDFDNSLAALKKRKLDLIVSEYQNIKYIHRSKISKMGVSNLKGFLSFLQKFGRTEIDLSNYLFVFDSAKNFIVDINSSKDVTFFFNVIKGLRDKGATILITHHTNRAGTFKGSSAFLEDADLMYRFLRNGDYFLLFCEKDRIPVSTKIAFEISFSLPDIEIKKAPLEIANLDEEDWEVVEAVKGALNESPYMKQGEILNTLKGKVEAGEKRIRKILSSLSGTFWEEEIGKHNSKIYSLIDTAKNENINNSDVSKKDVYKDIESKNDEDDFCFDF